ncbi:MAG: superoxide dismutase [Planctomycetaceae bacterium]
MMLNRRDFLAAVPAAALGLAAAGAGCAGGGEEPPPPSFALPPLPYAFDALEPHIDAKTMAIHHGKHHAGYVNNLSKALEPHPELRGKPLAELLAGLGALPDSIRTLVRNNGGGHANHTLFWETMAPGKGGEAKGKLGEEIRSLFGGFDKFREAFVKEALGRFGSGWAWLSIAGGRLELASSANQDSPLMEGKVPLLGLDVWEHAYYLKYQNRRADYVAAFWNLVDWEVAERRFLAAAG